MYLHETIDDPASDQLYLIQELCEGGEIMSGCNEEGEEKEEEDSSDAMIEGKPHLHVKLIGLTPPLIDFD